MRPLELAVMYFVMGVVVAIAVRWRGRPGALVALFAWPVMLPGLLAAPPAVSAEHQPQTAPAIASADGQRITSALAGLEQALGQWNALPRADDCTAAVGAARRGLLALAARLAQLDQVVGQLPPVEPFGPTDLVAARAENHRQLVALRDEARVRLDRSLASVAELTSRVHLARFTGAEEAEVAEQLSRLARAVDSAGEVSRL